MDAQVMLPLLLRPKLSSAQPGLPLRSGGIISRSKTTAERCTEDKGKYHFPMNILAERQTIVRV